VSSAGMYGGRGCNVTGLLVRINVREGHMSLFVTHIQASPPARFVFAVLSGSIALPPVTAPAVALRTCVLAPA
jgi:hypothetical protein